MADKDLSLEDRVVRLEKQIESLNAKVEKLSNRVQPLSESIAIPPEAEPEDSGQPSFMPAEELLAWVGKSALLPRIATICFILVVALILRTVTDNGLLGKELGSLCGMVYAAGLILLGWRRYAQKSALAPVFAAFGAGLMFSIVLEIHAHFGVLAATPAYLILIATGSVMAGISWTFSVALPIQVGTLGMCLVGAAMDFPHPVFPHLAVLLLIANILGFLASRIQRCSWLRWTLFAITLAMLQIWVYKLGQVSALQGDSAELLFPGLLLPALGLFGLCFLTMALTAMRRRTAARPSKFDILLPSLYPLWAFPATSQFLRGFGRSHLFALGLTGILTAAVYLALAFGLTKKSADNPPLVNSLVLGALVLLPLALPDLFGNPLTALPLLSLAAFGLALASQKWRSGGVRAMSYLLQLYVCVDLAYLLYPRSLTWPPLAAMAATAAGTVICLGHYLWCRRHPPLPDSDSFFFRFDEEDRTAVLLFLGALVAGFFLARIGLSQLLAPLTTPAALATFRCAQSITINGAAALLMVLAFVRKNREWRNVAILVTILGAGNVFLYDLLGTHGFPLVASVFAFGMAVALESVILRNWQRREDRGESRQTGDRENP